MSWELISSVMIITLPLITSGHTAVPKATAGLPLQLIFSFARSSEQGLLRAPGILGAGRPGCCKDWGASAPHEI